MTVQRGPLKAENVYWGLEVDSWWALKAQWSLEANGMHTGEYI